MSIFGPSRREIIDDAARVMDVLETDRDQAVSVARRLENALREEQQTRARAEEQAEHERERRTKLDKKIATLTKKVERGEEAQTRWKEERQRMQAEQTRLSDQVVKLTNQLAKMSTEGIEYVRRLRTELDAAKIRAENAELKATKSHAEATELLDQVVELQERLITSNPKYMADDEYVDLDGAPEPYDPDSLSAQQGSWAKSEPRLPDEQDRKLALQQRAAMARLRKTDVGETARFRILEDGERLNVLSEEERRELARYRVGKSLT